MNKRGYLDPGTGGYLVTSIWPTILSYVAMFVSVVGAFFIRYFVKPIKKFFKKNKKIILLTIIILLISGLFLMIYSLKPNENKLKPLTSLALTPSGELKRGMYMYHKNLTYPGYIMIQNKLLAPNGTVVHSWDSSTGMGVIQPDGTYVALRETTPLNRTVNSLTKYTQNGTYLSLGGNISIGEVRDSLVKYSWNGTLIWENPDVKPHHKISLTDENTILTITKEAHEYKGKLVDFDVILEFDQEGKEIWNWSTWDNLKYLQTFHKPLEMTNYNTMDYPVKEGDNSKDPVVTSIWGGNYDYYHMNSVEEIPENINSDYEVKQDGKIVRPFKQGNIIFNFRHGSMIFILDRETGKIVWHATQYDVPGEIQGQHDSSMLPDGNLLIFDNGRYRNATRVIELNPITMKIKWQYNATNFFSERRGDVSKLPNGNYLISDSVIGRMFEINSKGHIMWEYFNPKLMKTKEGILKNREIFQLKKYDKKFIDKFLN